MINGTLHGFLPWSRRDELAEAVRSCETPHHPSICCYLIFDALDCVAEPETNQVRRRALLFSQVVRNSRNARASDFDSSNLLRVVGKETLPLLRLNFSLSVDNRPQHK